MRIWSALLLSLFWKRTTKAGVAARFVSGTSVTIAWNQVSFLKNIIYELVPAFFVSALLPVIISFLTTPPKNAEKELKSIAARHQR